jgi:hypothetical protein
VPTPSRTPIRRADESLPRWAERPPSG